MAAYAEKLLGRAEAAGVELRAEGGRLCVRGSRAALAALADDLRAHRDDLVELLRQMAIEDRREHFEERAAIAEIDGGLSRSEAEQMAMAETYDPADGEPAPAAAFVGADDQLRLLQPQRAFPGAATLWTPAPEGEPSCPPCTPTTCERWWSESSVSAQPT